MGHRPVPNWQDPVFYFYKRSAQNSVYYFGTVLRRAPEFFQEDILMGNKKRYDRVQPFTHIVFPPILLRIMIVTFIDIRYI